MKTPGISPSSGKFRGYRNSVSYGRSGNWRSSKNGRRSDTRFRRWVPRHVKTSVDLFGDEASRQFRRKELTESQYGTDYVVGQNRVVTTYVTYPSKTRIGVSNRTRSYIRLVGLRMNGTFSVRFAGMETDVDRAHMVFGVLSVVVVRDKKPKIYSSASPLIPFVELFGSVEASKGTLRVSEHHRDRFVLLKQTSILVNSPHGITMKKFYMTNCIPTSYTTWATFKDEEEDHCTGQYSNTSSNALLVYYVWVSDVPSHADVYNNIILNYIG
uniref:Nuclear shuttle protein n=1 Tax=Coccinia mosaic Tamil Nadu virus TaxID=1532882 RepID=A0A0B5KMC7_9GEMI|nr:nuclear shuttle protein [Coccinia mosaic Tamil Nadu virus]